ncbi:hypothetical protein BHE74_00002396 [Ensete ventricosum]|nr:hypothetical protein BHE74_00002396 [Ensete ventricosum]
MRALAFMQEHKETGEVQTENGLADAETVAKSFGQGKRNPRALDPSVDHVRNPHYLVLPSENFKEACAALSRPSMPNLAHNQGISNQGIVKLDGASAAPISGPPATANPSVLVIVLPTKLELLVALDHTPLQDFSHILGLCPPNTIFVVHGFLRDNSNDNTTTYSSRVPNFASSCLVPRPSERNFTSCPHDTAAEQGSELALDATPKAYPAMCHLVMADILSILFIVNGSMMNRQPITVGSIPTATVKVEPTTVSPMVSGPAFSHLPSVANVASQGISSLQNSSPSSSQEMNANIDTTQEIKPLVNPISQSSRPAVPAPANVSILNNLSQHRQVMTSASIAGGSSIGLPTMGGTPMAVHMSNMISSGMSSSALSGISSVPVSGALMATSQVAQNTTLGSLTSASSNLSGNSNIGISSTLNNLQGNVPVGQSVSNVGQGTLTSGAQIGQGGMTINQNMMNNLVPSGVSSGPGTMIPTPGMTQQSGVHSLGVANNSAINMSLTQHAPSIQQSQSKYLKIWEICFDLLRDHCLDRDKGNLSLFVNLKDIGANQPRTRLQYRIIPLGTYRSDTGPVRLCAVIQLPSQTLLLSVSDKAGRLIGMLFPGVHSMIF